MDPVDVSEARVAEMMSGVAAYMRQERNLYFAASELLAPVWRTAVQPYFSKTLLETVRTVILKGARIPPPPFYSEAIALSSGHFPDFVHLASVTYLDIIVFHDEIAPSNALSRSGSCRANGPSRNGPLRRSLRSRFREVSYLDCHTLGSSGLSIGRPFCRALHSHLLRRGRSKILD